MMDVKHCDGCRDDFYNRRVEGGCWSRRTAEIVTRYRTGTWTLPASPGAFTEVEVPNCYHAEGLHFCKSLPDFVKAEDVRRAR